jgi:predicted ATPase
MLHLSSLGARDGLGIIAGVTKGKVRPDKIGEQILARTDGVPLIIEQVTNTLLESGLLHETPDRYILDGPMPPLAIPTTLQASDVVRLDRLAPVKDLAQTGSVIGREFSRELIAAMATFAPADFEPALRQLISSGLISRRVTPSDATYSFKHAMVQDAAYAMLRKSRQTCNR